MSDNMLNVIHCRQFIPLTEVKTIKFDARVSSALHPLSNNFNFFSTEDGLRRVAEIFTKCLKTTAKQPRYEFLYHLKVVFNFGSIKILRLLAHKR